MIFATCWFHTLVVSLAHTGGPATFAITQEPQVSLYKARGVCLCRDISAQRLIHSMGWPFVSMATLLNHALQAWLVMSPTGTNTSYTQQK